MGKTRKIAKIDWDMLADDLIKNCQRYHQTYYSEIGFTGPSLYFHQRALSASGNDKTELVYAVLTAWGMHRMGKKGAKMSEYSVFAKGIAYCEPIFKKLENIELEQCNEYEFGLIRELFHNLEPMASSTKIVGVSKVLAHYLPQIIAPVDRRYTFQLLNNKKGRTEYPLNWNEFELLREIHLRIFKPVAESNDFKRLANIWLSQKDGYVWDTSIPKIIDNLVIGKIKSVGWEDVKLDGE
jgi:hypothetical protein